jgi:hypothetical protein
VILLRLEQAGFQYRLGYLLHKQRYPIGLSHDLRDHLHWQCLALRDLVRQFGGLELGQAGQRHLGEV